MPAKIELYIDTYSGELVSGPDNRRDGRLFKFVQGDAPLLHVYLLERTTTYPDTNAYSIINNANLSLKAALGPKTGTAGSSLYTQQYTWDKDSQNQYFYARLPLNTSAIATLIAAAASARAWFEIEYVEDGYATTVFQKEVDIHAEVLETAALVAPPGETVLTLEHANATFLKSENTGFIMVNPVSGLKYHFYVGADGAPQFDPIA